MNSFEGDRVRIELSRDEFTLLLMALGAALASGLPIPAMVRLVNRINEGNPNFTPYEVPATSPKDSLS